MLGLVERNGWHENVTWDEKGEKAQSIWIVRTAGTYLILATKYVTDLIKDCAEFHAQQFDKEWEGGDGRTNESTV